MLHRSCARGCGSNRFVCSSVDIQPGYSVLLYLVSPVSHCGRMPQEGGTAPALKLRVVVSIGYYTLDNSVLSSISQFDLNVVQCCSNAI